MKQRIITAVILAPLVVLGIFYLSMPLFIAALAAVTLIGFWEWTQFVEARSRLMAMLPCVAVTGAVLALFPFDSAGLQAVAQPHLILLMVAALWWIAASALAIGYPGTTGLWQNSRVLRHLFGWLTLLPFFTSVVLLRAVPGEDAFYGARLVLFVCFLVWSADSGAYFAGKSFGRTKMAPNVSPNKTIEGLVGGIIAALIVGLGAAHWFEIQFASWWHFAGITLVTVVISVLGDLVESMFKRVSGIKDSSNIIPGHGGVLDRIDSLTAAFPVFALLYFTL